MIQTGGIEIKEGSEKSESDTAGLIPNCKDYISLLAPFVLISVHGQPSSLTTQSVVNGRQFFWFAGVRPYTYRARGEETPSEDVATVLEMLRPGLTLDDSRDWGDDWSSYLPFTADWSSVHRSITGCACHRPCLLRINQWRTCRAEKQRRTIWQGCQYTMPDSTNIIRCRKRIKSTGAH